MIKVGEVMDSGLRFQVMRVDDETNPYRVYMKWYSDGWHRKQIAKYSDMVSCMVLITDYMRKGIMR